MTNKENKVFISLNIEECEALIMLLTFCDIKPFHKELNDIQVQVAESYESLVALNDVSGCNKKGKNDGRVS